MSIDGKTETAERHSDDDVSKQKVERQEAKVDICDRSNPGFDVINGKVMRRGANKDIGACKI